MKVRRVSWSQIVVGPENLDKEFESYVRVEVLKEFWENLKHLGEL